MMCPYCDCGDTKVVDSRDSGADIRRRRECAECARRFTTYERVEVKTLAVVKQDGRREEFRRDKLMASLSKACAKRPLSVGRLQSVVDDIETRLAGLGRAEVATRAIGELVMERLAVLDRVAYIRFASVYRDFQDITRFKDEVDALMEPDEGARANQLSLLGGSDGSGGGGKRGRRRQGSMSTGRRASKRGEMDG